MTKLFSMKSLAFAGAAAFAVALAAAPQVDAFEASDVTFDQWDSNGTEYGKSLKFYISSDISTPEGAVIYYQTGKDASSIKENKYTAITDENLGYYDFSSLLGKDKYIAFSADGKDMVTGTAIKAAPKLKAKLDGKDGLKLEIDKQTAKITASGGGIVTCTAGGKTYDVYGIDENMIKSASMIGGTLQLTAVQQEGTAAGYIPSPSATVKLKVPARAKAPKASLKLDSTKQFKWKVGDKNEYVVDIGGVQSKWTPGTKTDKTWTEIMKDSGLAGAADVVTGDAITADVKIYLRTKADKKAASAIQIIDLKQSAAAPTTAASIKITKAEIKDDKVKKATSAAIEAKADIQYSTDNGEKWKKLNSGKSANLKATETTVLVRIPGVAKNGFVLPSLNNTFTIDYNAGTYSAAYATE